MIHRTGHLRREYQPSYEENAHGHYQHHRLDTTRSDEGKWRDFDERQYGFENYETVYETLRL
jgi:hypothetical protein